uniref:Peptidase metallopeptidase domain-containing protein n=1 Tax=Oryza meridionalis TaxID=40149 RepID=A0A0E0F0X1_9ORYZ
MFLLCGCGTASQPAPTTATQLRPQDNNGGSGAAFTFLRGRPRWNRPDMRLTYAVSPMATVDHLPRDAVREAFRSAFARWAEVTPLRFAEAERYEEADIRVGFYLHASGAGGDGCGHIDDKSSRDGPLLAHSFPAKDGRIHMHAARRWTVDLDRDTAAAAVDLESVATHEIGHVLGLGHSSSKSSVMYRYVRYRERKVDLTEDDVHGVQELYGPNPHFSFNAHFNHIDQNKVEQEKGKVRKGKARGSSFWRRGLASISCLCPQ